ncbi:MAG: SGNH/GDSL hydrolase family protein [Anaerolineales bacterium]|nr:SGNH/GDSL hydrolase family protein [Anaerolineales bacterium]
MKKIRLFSVCLALLIASCANLKLEQLEVPVATTEPTVALIPSTPSSISPTPQATLVVPLPSLEPAEWREWPVLPAITAEMLAIYQRGQEMGNNPRAFSKVGDGEISTVWFFAHYDLEYYTLGDFYDLQAVIHEFTGSFNRQSQAARRGFNTTLILDPSAAAQDACMIGEMPLECELRLHRPSFAFISLGTNQVWQPEIFEAGLRQIIEKLLEQGVIPILSTKGDNLEGDHRINQIIAELANEYHAPLWNFWRVVQPLPSHGLQEDLEHLTYAPPDFSDAYNMQAAWPWRNLTALQVLDALWRDVSLLTAE